MIPIWLDADYGVGLAIRSKLIQARFLFGSSGDRYSFQNISPVPFPNSKLRHALHLAPESLKSAGIIPKTMGA